MVMSLATIQNVLLCTTVVCMHCSLYFFFSALLVVVIWYLVFPIILVRAYLTFPKAVVLILKQATSLRLSMLPGPALIQADLDYQRVGVDKKIQQHIVASTDSAWQDRDFIMTIEMVCLFLSFQTRQGFYFQLQVWQMSVHKRDCFWNWNSHRWCCRVAAEVA